MSLIFGCGKVILFGEHAVVYGQPALAAALSIGVRALDITPLAPGAPLVVEVEPWGTTTSPNDGTRMGESVARVLASIEGSCGSVRPARVRLEATVPVGAGLGSSAALAVVLARALISLGEPPRDPMRAILSAAEASEEVFHGNPSGVDHTTSALGGVLVFQRGQEPAFRRLATRGVSLIIAQMEPGADTGAMVAGVQRRRDAEPEAIDAVMDTLGHLTRRAEAALASEDARALGLLMDIAHGGLVSIGVSTEALDRGCHAARRAGAYGAKLTGAGGGGCLIAVGPDDKEPIMSALRDAGALEVFSVVAGFGGDPL